MLQEAGYDVRNSLMWSLAVRTQTILDMMILQLILQLMQDGCLDVA